MSRANQRKRKHATSHAQSKDKAKDSGLGKATVWFGIATSSVTLIEKFAEFFKWLFQRLGWTTAAVAGGAAVIIVMMRAPHEAGVPQVVSERRRPALTNVPAPSRSEVSQGRAGGQALEVADKTPPELKQKVHPEPVHRPQRGDPIEPDQYGDAPSTAPGMEEPPPRTKREPLPLSEADRKNLEVCLGRDAPSADEGQHLGPEVASHCHPQVRSDSSSRFPYAERGDRCEGDIKRYVSAGMSLLSLTRGPALLGARYPDEVDLSWSHSLNSEHVVVQTGRWHAYRMDASARGSQFRWKTDVIRARANAMQHITPQELGFLVYSGRNVLVPVSVQRAGHEQGPYTIEFRLAEAVEEAYASLDDIGPWGKHIIWGGAHVVENAQFDDAAGALAMSIPPSTRGAGVFELSLRTLGRGMHEISVVFCHD